MREIVTWFIDREEMTPKEARRCAAAMCRMLQEQVLFGQKVDLGFLKIEPYKRQPQVIRHNLPDSPKKNHTYLIGEHTGWRIRITKGWQKAQKPSWSRF